MNRLSEKLSSYFKLAENNTTVRTEVLAGITSFITIIGLKNSGLVVSNEATLVSLVDFSQWRTPGADISGLCGALVTLIGLITIGILHIKKVRGSIFPGIIVATIVGIPLGVTSFDGLSFDIGGKFGDFFETSFLRLDFAGLFVGEDLFNSVFSVIMLVISFSLVNMFDSIGTLVGAARQSGMVDEDGVIPSAATAPALIFVGILMLSNVKDVDLNDMEKAMPAFCTIVFMPFTYSIANGIALGLITHCLILLLTGKGREVKPLTIIVSLIFIARYAFITLG